jgi:hypothetical protein
MAALVFGCGGGGDDGGSDAPTDDATTLAALTTSNLNFATGTPGFLRRWDLPIPVKLNGEPRATAAIDEIERQLGYTVFDRTSIANTPDPQITHGLIISVGTAVGVPGGDPAFQCGSGGPPNGVFPPWWTSALGNNAGTVGPGGVFVPNFLLSGVNWVNLDGPICVASLPVTIHEFMHVMGMYGHFQDFGNGAPIGPLAWRVLRTTYGNPVGTPASAIVPR